MPAEKPSFACSSCGKTYRHRAELAGRRVTCKCGESFRVPPEPEPEPEEEAEESGGYELNLPEGFAPAESAAPATNEPADCVRCRRPPAPGAVFCTACGTDQRTGRLPPPPPPLGEDDEDDDGGAPAASRGRMTAVLWGINGQLIALILTGLSVIVGVIAWFQPSSVLEGVGLAIELCAAAAGGLGVLLCLASPSPLGGRISLGVSLLLYLVVGIGSAAVETMSTPWWLPVALQVVGTAASLCFIWFLVTLADHLGFDEVSDQANKVFWSYVALALCTPLLLIPFLGCIVVAAVLVLTVYAFVLYVGLLFDLSRSVAYRRG